MVNELYHYGIKGQKWGVRRYQNKDGTLTEAGRKRSAKLHNTYIGYLEGNPNKPNRGLKKAARAALERGRLRGKTDRQSVLLVEQRAVERMERAAKIANNMLKKDPNAEGADFERSYKVVQKQREAAFRGYMFLASEMSKQAGIYDKPLSDSDSKLSEELGRRWAKAYEGDMYKFDTKFLPSEMKQKFNL